MAIYQRQYMGTQADLQSVQDAVMSWRRDGDERHYCHAGDVPHRIYNGQRGRYPAQDLMSIWHDDGDIVAFSIHSPRHRIWELYLHPDKRDSTLEKDAIHHAEECTLANMPADATHLEAACAESDTVRHAFLQELGYKFSAPDMALSRRSLLDELPQRPLMDDLSIRGVTLDDVRQIADVHEAAFGTYWSDEEYSHVMTSPGYDPAM